MRRRMTEPPGSLMTDEAKDPELEMLEARVRVMRAIGVVEWGNIKLGPDPLVVRPDVDETQRTADAERLKRERDYRLRNGASGGPRPRVQTG